MAAYFTSRANPDLDAEFDYSRLSSSRTLVPDNDDDDDHGQILISDRTITPHLVTMPDRTATTQLDTISSCTLTSGHFGMPKCYKNYREINVNDVVDVGDDDDDDEEEDADDDDDDNDSNEDNDDDVDVDVDNITMAIDNFDAFSSRHSIFDLNSETPRLNRNVNNYDEGDIVPPLDIQSEDGFSLESMKTFQYRNKEETSKLEPEPDKAYDKWLSEKLKAKTNEAARRKREAEKKQREQEERKRLAEEKYQQWLDKKKKNGNTAMTWKPRPGMTAFQLPSSRSLPAPMPLPTPAAVSLPDSKSECGADKQRKLQEWALAKRKQEEQRRKQERKQQEERERREAERKALNDKAWEKWVEKSKNRPKPVPLNQGFLSLRGTVSDIFINPNEWQSN